MELSYPPFEMRDARGEPAGVSVDLAHALGESLGRSVQIENLPFDGLIPALTPDGERRSNDKRGLWLANGDYEGGARGLGCAFS